MNAPTQVFVTIEDSQIGAVICNKQIELFSKVGGLQKRKNCPNNRNQLNIACRISNRALRMRV